MSERSGARALGIIVLSIGVMVSISVVEDFRVKVGRLEKEVTALREKPAVAGKPNEEKSVEERKHLFDGPKPIRAKQFKVKGLWRDELTIGHHDPWKEDIPMVLHLWGPWCGPCRAEFPSLLAFSRKHPGLQIATVSVNNKKEDVLAFLKYIGYDESKNHVAIFIGSEEDIIFADNYYKVSYFPTTIFIDRDGNIVRWIDGMTNWRDPALGKFVGELLKKK